MLAWSFVDADGTFFYGMVRNSVGKWGWFALLIDENASAEERAFAEACQGATEVVGLSVSFDCGCTVWTIQNGELTETIPYVPHPDPVVEEML